MAVCRDWSTTLRRASYRGVAFFVEADTIDTGRRLVVHEFPHKDAPYIEDLGRKANSIQVTAYLVGDNIEQLIRGLQAACDAGGPAVLNLPMERLTAHCEDCRRDYSKDKLGHVAFALKFWRQGTGPGPFSLLSLARAVEFAAGAIVAPITSAFVTTYQTLGEHSYVRAAASSLAATFFGEFDQAIRSAPLEAATLGPILRQVESAIERADALTLVGAVGDRYSNVGFVQERPDALTGEIVTVVTGLFTSARLAMAPQDAAAFTLGFAEWGSDDVLQPGSGGARMTANQNAFNRLVRAAAMAQYATAVTLREYDDVRDARQARADAAEYFAALLDVVKDWPDVWAQLADLRGRVNEHLHRTITDLAPVLELEAAARMPSLWWANYLYADAERAGEVYKRNGVKHAGFMPIKFEVLAR
jgi:prophage DNA circulation protein